MRKPLHSLARFGRHRGGVAAVEFAMVFPLLIVLMLGVICIAQAFFTVSSVQWAVEKAARELMIDGDATGAEVEARANELLTGMTDATVALDYAEEVAGGFPFTRLETVVHYPVRIPLVPETEIRYHIEIYVPRPYRPA